MDEKDRTCRKKRYSSNRMAGYMNTRWSRLQDKVLFQNIKKKYS